jgi:geranylgeranyl diphosphate synthase type II
VRARLAEIAPRVDRALEELLPTASPHCGELNQALRHVLQGGKRLRPYLVWEAAEAQGLAGEKIIPAACAFELLHTATLIHDDLPCIDDAPLRRGAPSCHALFGEELAVLAGDSLILASFELLGAQAEVPETPPDVVLPVMRELSHHAGVGGVIGGETADILAERLPCEANLLAYIHRHKTASLFIAACRAGAWLGGAEAPVRDLMGAYGEKLGLLFQVTDDLLDATATEEDLGKPVRADAAAGKQTYPRLLGLAGAQDYAAELARETREVAARLRGDSQVWAGLAELVLVRSS